MSNQFDNALDDAEAEEDANNDDAGDEDLDELWDAAAAGGSEKTIGFGVNEELHEIYTQLRESDEVDVDLAQNMRDQIITIAKRHPEVAERAKKIIDVKRGDL